MSSRIIKINVNNFSEEEVQEAINIVKKGGVVVYPTDTVYGIGGVIDRESTIERIVAIKKRGTAPFPIIVSKKEHAMELGHFNNIAKMLAEEFWPGPLTIKVEAKRELHDRLVDEENKVALRIPDCEIARILANAAGGAIIGTSANVSGQMAPITIHDVIKQIGEEVDIIIDGGPTKYKTPSTIIDVSATPPVILRVGAVPPEAIEDFLGIKIKIKG